MNIEFLIQSNLDGKTWEISELTDTITWSTQIIEQPGKLTFNFIDASDTVFITEGSIVRLKVNDVNVFYGYVFKIGVDNNEKISVTAYDQLRYLKNKDTYVINNMTASQLFTKICDDFKLKYSVLDASTYIIPPTLADNKSLFETIQTGINYTLANAGMWYTVRDNFGTIEFQDINRLKTLVVIGDESSLSSYSFESSIDDDTYNQVKLVKENNKTKKREVYAILDSANIAKWGTLQYFEKVDEDANEAQIKAKAEMIMKTKNRQTKTLKLDTVLGDLRVTSGSGVILSIEKLAKRGIAINQYFMVTAATHTFSKGTHLMSLEVQVSV